MLSGLLVLDRLAKVIVVSGQGDKQNALRAVGAGAYDFLCKPVDMDELEARAAALRLRGGARAGVPRHAGGRAARGLRGHAGREPADAGRVRVRPQGGDHERPGPDPRRERDRQGDGGAGAPPPERRSAAARSCPSTATRSRRTCSRASCSATRRARSPAPTRSRKGLIETAAGGTLFLDEIGELPASLQVKLLRFLQEKTFQRVGGRQEIQSDARVVAATNINLQEAVASGKFREDLYFRLAVLVVTLPALRERGDDVILVAREFLRRYGAQHGKPGLTFAPDALRALSLHTLAGQHPRAAEPGAAGGHHGRGQARHRRRPGAGRCR